MISKGYHIFEDVNNKVFQIRTKSEIILAEFINDIEKQIFIDIVAQLDKGINFPTLADLKSRFKDEYPEENIMNVVRELQQYNLWEEAPENSPSYDAGLEEQIQFWKNSEYEGCNDYQQKIENARITVIGTSRISSALGKKLDESGFRNVTMHNTVFFADETEIERFVKDVLEKADFFLIDAENWSPSFLDTFNKLAYDHGKPWLLIRGLSSSIGSIGPLFIGRNTGCYKCLDSRIKSNMEFLPYFFEYEKFLIRNQQESKGSAGPVVFYDMLANIAVLETVKFISEWTLPIVYKAFLTIDMYTYDVKVHPFLKAPVCPVCHPKVDFKLAPWLEPVRVALASSSK